MCLVIVVIFAFKFMLVLNFCSPPSRAPQGVKSDHERQKEQHAAGGGGGLSGFDSGRTWGSSVPKVDIYTCMWVQSLEHMLYM